MGPRLRGDDGKTWAGWQQR